ncbi:MAG: tRNA (adenosine(37)-N6)-threonylcarbamoyltransferase complex ATPase subunit type 1 TsaE [Bacilli bacterium]|nr:tRNA (adenosine(37)-N6)-threonylcarbamoyltransferase complex ATPase subunit type 1 TsaE [Bacilli bacterium]
MEKVFTSKSQEETISLGEQLAHLIPNGTTLLLTGDLGAGKTTLVRGIGKGLHIKDVIQSPTFNIMKIYLKADKPLIHIDAYRLADIPNNDIGLDEYIGYETGITVIEWPNYIENLIPKNHVEVTIVNLGDDNRKLTFKGDNLSFLEGVSL